MKRKMLIWFFSIFALLLVIELFNFETIVQVVKPVEIRTKKAPEQAGNTDNITEGATGTCSWLIDKDYNLIVWPTDEVEGTLGDFPQASSVPWYNYREQIVSAKFINKIYGAENCRTLLYGCINLKEADLSGLDTSNVTNMNSMFYNCSALEELDVSNFDTSNVTSMSTMFYGCKSLKELDITNFDTSKVTKMNSMFTGLTIKELDLSNFDTTSVENMVDLFGAGGNSIKTIKLGEKCNFKIDQTGGTTFGRGTWKKVEDGKNYSVLDICEKSLTGEAAGTYKKLSDVSKELPVNFPVNYKINSVTEVSEFSTDREDIYERNNRSVFAKMPLTDTDEYIIPGKAELKFDDMVEDEDGNKYDLKMKIDNIHVNNLTSESGIDEVYLYICNIGTKISLEKNFFKIPAFDSDERVIVNNNHVDVKYSVTFNIVDKDGNAVDGNYIFSAYDIDIGSYRDSLTSEYINLDGWGYGNYSEGINLVSGFDLDTITFSDPTALMRMDGNRITGTKNDSTCELSEFLIKADSREVKFDWTAGCDCGTTLFSYYQPQSVDIVLQNTQGENLPGGDLELYYYDDKTEEWVTVDEPVTYFLVPGEYVLKEVNAPENYDKTDDITFFVDTNYRLIRDEEEVDRIVMINDFKNTKINVYHYIEGTTDPVILSDGNPADVIEINKKVTENYETEPADVIEYYELVETPSNHEGVATEEPIDVIYYYRLKEYPYTVNYYDKDEYDEDTGKYEKIIDSKTDGKETYGKTIISASEIIPIEGYNYDSVSTDSIVINTENNTIDIFYTKRNDLKYTVNYLEKVEDEDSIDIVIETPKTESNQIYNTEISSSDEIIPINGYEYDSSDVDSIVISTNEEENVINLYYKKAKFEYTVEYYYNDKIDEEKTETHEATYLDIISDYTDKNIYGYRLKEEVLPIEITYDNAKNVMKVYYIIDDEQTKDISYKVEYYKDNRQVVPDAEIETNTVQVLEPDTLEVDKDKINTKDKYKGFDFEKITLNDETIVKLPDTVNDNDIIKVYYKSIDSKIIVKYVDRNDKIIKEDYIIDGKAYEEYNLDTVPDKIEGYTLLSKTEEGTVQFDETPREVTFKYGKDAKVVVNFIDINNDEIIETTTIEGFVDDEYSADPRGYDGYELVKKPDNETGTMTDKETVVNYYYAKKSAGVIENHVDLNSGKVLYTETHRGNEGDSYSIKSKEFEDYDLVESKLPKNAEGEMTVQAKYVTYYYAKKAKVIVKYLEINTNNVVADEVTIEGHEGDSYNTEEKVLLRYSFLKLQGTKDGKMKAGDNEVIYYYTAIRVDQGAANTISAGTSGGSNVTYTSTGTGNSGNTVVTVDSNGNSSTGTNTSSGSSNTSGNVKAGDDLPITILGIILLVITLNGIQILVENKDW